MSHMYKRVVHRTITTVPPMVFSVHDSLRDEHGTKLYTSLRSTFIRPSVSLPGAAKQVSHTPALSDYHPIQSSRSITLRSILATRYAPYVHHIDKPTSVCVPTMNTRVPTIKLVGSGLDCPPQSGNNRGPPAPAEAATHHAFKLRLRPPGRRHAA